MEEDRNAFKMLSHIPTGKWPLGRPSSRWEDNIRLDPKDPMKNWFDLAQVRDYWRVLVNAALSPRIPCLPVKISKALLPSSILATGSAHLKLLGIISLPILGELCNIWTSSMWSIPHSPFSSFMDPNNHLSIVFSNTLSLHSSNNVRDQIFNQII